MIERDITEFTIQDGMLYKKVTITSSKNYDRVTLRLEKQTFDKPNILEVDLTKEQLSKMLIKFQEYIEVEK